MKRKIAIIAALVIAVGAVSAGFAIAGGSGDDQPVSGPAADRATAAALKAAGGGEVLEVEAGDDGAAYGVEVRKADGSVVEIQLDGDFNVTGEEADDDAGGEDESGPDDD